MENATCNASELVFVGKSGKHQTIVDYVTADQKGQYSGKTLNQLKADYPDVCIMSSTEAVKQIESDYTTDPVEITKERFWDLLECLPPAKWCQIGGSEVFHVCERITYSIVTWCIRVGTRYFSLDCTDKMPPHEVVALVKAKSQLAPGVAA